MSNLIAVHHGDHEGGIHIDATTGGVMTASDDCPEWANGLAVGVLKERNTWYETRLGQVPDSILKAEIIDMRDLTWLAWDAERDLMELEADNEFRMDTLATLLNVDREDFDGEKTIAGVIASAEVDHTYTTNPTAEATLEEVEGMGFEDVKKAVNA